MNDCCRQQNTISFTVNDSSVCVDTLLLLMGKNTESLEGKEIRGTNCLHYLYM